MYSVFALIFILNLSSCQDSQDSFNQIPQNQSTTNQKLNLENQDGIIYVQNERSIAIYGYDDNVDKVNLIIPAEINGLPVTEIGAEAFYLEKSIVSVELPATITKIGKFAFASCENLKTINLPESLKIIDEGAFQGCAIAKITIPKSIEQMDEAFSGCKSLKEVNLEEGIAIVSGFNGCTALSKIDIPSSVKKIGNSAFYKTNIEEFNLPDNLEIIGDYAFEESNITEIKLPDTVKKIGAGAFRHNDLTQIELPPSLEEIEDWAFAYTKLKSITIPNGVTYIGNAAFSDTEIEELTLPPSLENLNLSLFSGMNLTTLYIPSTVKKIQNRFNTAEDQTKLKTVTIACDIDESSYELGSEGFTFYGEPIESERESSWTDENGEVHTETYTYTDYNGVDLIFEDTAKYISGKLIRGYFNSVVLGKETTLEDFNSEYYYKHPLESFSITSDKQVFSGSIHAKEVNINADALVSATIDANKIYVNTDCTKSGWLYLKDNIEINSNDFSTKIPEGTSAREFIIADGVKTFSFSCDFDGVMIEKIEIPDSLEKQEFKFENCIINSDIYIKNYIEGYSRFSYCIINGNITVSTPQSNYTFYKSKIKSLYAKSTLPSDLFNLDNIIEKITLSPNVTLINDKTFLGVNFKEIDLSNVTHIGAGAFGGCNDLEKIDLSNVTYIGADAFGGCNLKKIDLSNTTYIGARAFSGCKNLEKVIFGSNPTILKKYAFNTCTKAEFVFNGPILLDETDEYGYIFAYCENLKEIDLSDKTYIPIGCFQGCKNLEKVIFGTKTTTIGKEAFQGCTKADFIFNGPISFTYDTGKVTYYAISAFEGCENLKEIDLSNITVIPEGIFKNCTGLKKVIFPTELVVLYNESFKGCSNAEFEFNGPICFYSWYDRDKRETIQEGDYCFDGCTKITKKPVIEGNEPATAFINTSITN